MTERGAGDLEQSPSTLRIGPSALRWHQGSLVIDIREITVPWPRRLTGTVTLHPHCHQPEAFTLDSGGKHYWWPASPIARVEVAMDSPGLHWEGGGYLDSNWGAEPLEDCFSCWNWSRAHLQNGDTAVIYEPHQKNRDTQLLAWRFDPQGGKSALQLGPAAALPDTAIWRVGRNSRCDLDGTMKVRKTLEDTPFYARTLLDTQLSGEPAVAVHESLSLDRFAQPWVQRLLPFRMPRRASRIWPSDE